MSANWVSEPKTRLVEVATFREVWLCTSPDCDGELEYNGFSYATIPAGHVHRCTKCNYSATPTGGQQFPRTVTRAK
jgi:hypothetical protein